MLCSSSLQENSRRIDKCALFIWDILRCSRPRLLMTLEQRRWVLDLAQDIKQSFIKFVGGPSSVVKSFLLSSKKVIVKDCCLWLAAGKDLNLTRIILSSSGCLENYQAAPLLCLSGVMSSNETSKFVVKASTCHLASALPTLYRRSEFLVMSRFPEQAWQKAGQSLQAWCNHAAWIKHS